MKSNTKLLKKVNGHSVQIIEEKGQKLVPIKPICEALGIDAKVQRAKIYSDDILGSVGVLSTSTGADGKQYEMLCLPLKYVFGWLFTINPKNVREEAQVVVLRYRQECYDALYNHFAETSLFLEEKGRLIEMQLKRYDTARMNFAHVKKILTEEKIALDELRKMDIYDWKRKNAQLELNFDEDEF